MERTIDTGALRLRPLVASDLPVYRRLLSLPAVAAANGSPADAPAATIARWFYADQQSPYALAVTDRATARFMGTILYYQHEDAGAQREYDLGYFLDPDDWGRGVMPAAVRASFTLVAAAGPAVVWATCLATNHRSRRVLEKLGFSCEVTRLAAPQHPALFRRELTPREETDDGSHL